MVGGELAGAGMLDGENGCGVDTVGSSSQTEDF